MSIIRTDAGLIYNTDGSLCVTLLPEGGVAIDEENIIEGQPVPVPGNLQIPTGPPLSMLESGTIAFTIWTPKTSWGTGHDALIDVGGILQLKLEGNGIEGFTIIPNVKYKMAITWQNGQNTKLYLLREGEMLQKSYDTVYSEAGDGIIRFGRFKDNVNSTNTIRIKDLLIQATAISFETVKTWFGIKGPFFDPGEHYDATARPIYAPGVVIDSTGAWGIANGVKQAGFGTDGTLYGGAGAFKLDGDGLEIDTQQFKLDKQGNAIFGGELAANIVTYNNLNVAFATVRWPTEEILEVAQTKEDWNEVKFSNILADDEYFSLCHLYHNELTTLIGGYDLEIRVGTLPTWVKIGQIFGEHTIGYGNDWQVILGVPQLHRDRFLLWVKKSYSYVGNDFYVRFKRHSIT